MKLDAFKLGDSGSYVNIFVLADKFCQIQGQREGQYQFAHLGSIDT